MLSVSAKVLASRGKNHLRLKGCPVSVAEQVLLLASLGDVKNPSLDSGQVVAFNRSDLAWRTAMAAKRLRGVPYQRPGPSPRGEGRPELPSPAPPPGSERG